MNTSRPPWQRAYRAWWARPGIMGAIAGMDGYVSKPLDLKEINRSLAEAFLVPGA